MRRVSYPQAYLPSVSNRPLGETGCNLHQVSLAVMLTCSLSICYLVFSQVSKTDAQDNYLVLLLIRLDPFAVFAKIQRHGHCAACRRARFLPDL